MLDVSVGGGCEIDQFLLLVADQITILVLTEPKGSRLDDQNAAVDEGDAANVDHVVHEGGRLVHLPIPVSVFQNHHPTLALIFIGTVQVDHIGAKFPDPHPALVVPIHENGILDHGLGGDELDLEPGRDLELGERFLGREDGHGVRRPFLPVERGEQILGLSTVPPLTMSNEPDER